MEQKNHHAKKTLRLNHFIEKEKLWKYLSSILSIDNDEADLGKKTNNFINEVSDFNNKHIINCNNEHIYNIPEEPRYISSRTPLQFRNGQYKARCYVNSSFQMIFKYLFLNVILEYWLWKIIESLDNSIDDYTAYVQKFMILQVIQQIFWEMLFGERKVFNSDVFFQSLISGQIFKMIIIILKGYFTRWFHRNPLLTKSYVTLIWMVKRVYALCQHT